MNNRKNFLIIIGGQRCGSSALFDYLSPHPLIMPTMQKECRFFLDGNYQVAKKSRRKYDGKMETYLKFFEKKNKALSGQWYLDSSPDYINSPGTPQRIKDFFKNENLILVAILRDPIDRFLSWFHYDKQLGSIRADMTLNEYLEENLKENASPPYTRLSTGCYSQFLDPYRKLFPKQLVLYRFEYLKTSKNILIQNLLDKMGLDQDFVFNDNKAHNASHEVKSPLLNRIYMMIRRGFINSIPENSWLYRLLRKASKKYQRLNYKPAQKEVLDEQIRMRLKEYYKEEYEFLDTLN